MSAWARKRASIGPGSLSLTWISPLMLRLLNAVLGEGMSSRLFTGIREKRGVAYSVNSYISALYDTGVVGV